MQRMDLSVIAIGDIQNVLSAMQKNLECPICLDVVEEPVSTKCDHIFCRFCMFKLLSKKKKGVIECPLCKTEVTKRSLKENSRFKELIEGLLETIHAFELDTGVKFLNSHHFPKTSTEASAAEFLHKESSVVQSKGFRNRKNSAKENGQENCTLEANVDTQLTDTRVKRRPLRNKTKKRGSEKGIYIEFGSDSSEDLYKQSSNTGLEDKAALQSSSQEKLEELKSARKWNEYSCSAQPDKLGGKETILPNAVGESDFSMEGLSKKSTWSTAECAKPGQVNMTEYQSCPLNVLAVDLPTEQRDRIGNASPLRKGDTSFFKSTEEMDAEQTRCHNKSKEFDLKDKSSENRLGKTKEVDIVQSVEAVEMHEPENDSFCEKELPQEKLLQPETLHCAAVNQVSRKRLKRSIQKVNEWFSKSDEILSSDSSQDDSAGATDVSGEDKSLSDKDSCVSEKTDPMVDSVEIAVVERNKRWSKQTADSIKDKIFGKTYQRERKSNPPVILREILPTTKKEDVATDEKCLNNSSKDRPKRKRKTACVLQPEDFIKKKDTEKADGHPQSVSWCLEDAEKKRSDESSAVNESYLSEKREDNTLAELEEGGRSMWKKAAEKVTVKHCDGNLELNNCDQKSTKKSSSAAKRCRRSTRTMCALQLVVDRNSVSPDPAEPQIDSYPSSEERRKVDSEQRQVRRSRRLQLLSEEMTKETGKGVVIKASRKHGSDHEGSVFGDQRNMLVHTSECEDLCEPQGMSSYKSLTNLKGGDLEADEMRIRLKNSSDTAETGKSPFNPTPSCEHSNCSSFAPDAGSHQKGEIQGSPFLLQSPSITVVQTASHPPEEMTEPCTTFPQDSGHDTQNIPGDFRTEKLPIAKNGLELTKEAEDSELDTQYLRNIFRHSKRLSFSLYPTPMKACEVEDAASKTSKIPRADQVENKHRKYLKTENLQEEKTAAESLSRVCEKKKLKTHESACVSPATCSVSSTECMHAGEHQDVSQFADQGNLRPIRTGTARSEDKNRLQKGEQGNEKTGSADIGIESELRQNPIGSNRSQSDQSNTEGHIFKRTDLNTVDEIHFSSENNQAGKAKAVDGKGPLPSSQSRSMICPATCQQRPAEFSCEVVGKKSSKRERKRVKGNEEQATQTASTGMPECLVTEALEEPLKVSSDFTGLSETPDGLLCSDDDIEENTSFSETDRKDESAVFVKRSGNALVKELHDRSVDSKPRSPGVQRSRRRARKLQSSDEESSEDEDLPCFQTLIFGRSVSAPLQINKQGTSLVESSQSPVTLPHNGSHGDNSMQKMPEAAESNGCVSPSQESECSVNLFSSQSNTSEESLNGAQELKKPLIQVHTSKQVSNVNDSKETFESCNRGLKRSKTNFRDECREDPNVGANLGEASGYDSETSIVEDSCGLFSQGEILTTQQKNVMQNNLKKLQQEMAVLEAVLKQHGSQDCGFLPNPIHRELPHSSSEGTFGMEQMRQERGAESTLEENSENHKCSISKGFSANDFHVISSDSLSSESKELEKERSPELLLPSSKPCLLKRADLEEHLQSDSVLKNKAPSGKTKPVQEVVQEYNQYHLEAENADEQKTGTRLNSASVLSHLSGNMTRSPDSSSSSLRLLNPRTAEATDSSVAAQDANKSRAEERKSKRSVRFPISALHNAAGKENATSPVVTNRKEMSIVASGLNQSEHLVVQKFARKTQSTLSNHITEGTTHVIMKTDKDLVCERTLKYFLGIAGRKWVVSYQWVIQSFKEGKILPEENFEVRGDVINGRNHQGPKRARQSLTEKIFKGFEICCCGPFTDMTTEHLEWMVELCGASVVKQLHLFTHKTNSTAVVVVQPDAWMENTDYRAIQQKNNVAMVTREWVLDSVACYTCQEFDAYLVS
ncbi:breast cancer type 1 susceptibility protein isoform X2 [Phalacrocorax aristotelis]|uniref:breast cancer type 1 susceptibility protein isoform X2 n=1 Tax=Phalacrocorax aristotelis TaxID=126867 RepID=UPI003F4B204F